MSLLMLHRFWVAPVVVMVAWFASLSDAGCGYEAIFNFGDSNSDTGGFWYAFPEAPSPNGMTYFKHPAGRASNGRLIIDFIGIPLPFSKSLCTYTESYMLSFVFLVFSLCKKCVENCNNGKRQSAPFFMVLVLDNPLSSIIIVL